MTRILDKVKEKDKVRGPNSKPITNGPEAQNNNKNTNTNTSKKYKQNKNMRQYLNEQTLNTNDI